MKFVTILRNNFFFLLSLLCEFKIRKRRSKFWKQSRPYFNTQDNSTLLIYNSILLIILLIGTCKETEARTLIVAGAMHDVREFSYLMRIMPQVYTRAELKREIISGSTWQFWFHVGIYYLHKSKPRI